MVQWNRRQIMSRRTYGRVFPYNMRQDNSLAETAEYFLPFCDFEKNIKIFI